MFFYVCSALTLPPCGQVEVPSPISLFDNIWVGLMHDFADLRVSEPLLIC
jgi:hypothetical protein